VAGAQTAAQYALPDSPASVNAMPFGLSKAVVDAASGRVSTQSVQGCPSTYACGWIDSGFANSMGRWAGTNQKMSAFGQSRCRAGNWNDCISSLANAGTSCTVHWFWDSGLNGSQMNTRPGYTSSSLGGWNDKISSNNWC
jgi:hypothetical protein